MGFQRREFLSTRGNLGRLPKEGGLDPSLLQKQWQLHLGRKENVPSEINTSQSGSKHHSPSIYQQNTQNGHRIYLTELVIPKDIMLSYLPAFTCAVPSTWNILSHLHLHFHIQECCLPFTLHFSAQMPFFEEAFRDPPEWMKFLFPPGCLPLS